MRKYENQSKKSEKMFAKQPLYPLELAITNFFGQSVDIQVTANLSGTWELLTTLVLINGIGQFSDSSGTNFPQRFYRALAQ